MSAGLSVMARALGVDEGHLVAFKAAVEAFQVENLTPAERHLGETLCFVAGITRSSPVIRTQILTPLFAGDEVTWDRLHEVGRVIEAAFLGVPATHAALAAAKRVLPHLFDGTFPDELTRFPVERVRPLFDVLPPSSSAALATH